MSPARDRDDPYAPMRPRWGRRVPRVFSVVVLVAFTFAAVTIPGSLWTVLDRTFLFLVGAAIAGVLLRYSLIEARPDRRGLFVRNLFSSRRIDWEEIVSVRFGGGDPWVSLDLTDTDTVAVMGIQKADGSHGRALASRLAALVDHHGRESTGGAND